MAASRPTLADVARAAEVSVPTVSKVLTGRSDVAERTRLRILEVMRELGYPLRGTGGGERHGIVDLLVGGIESLWAVAVIRGAEEAAARLGRSLVVTSAMHEGFTFASWTDAVLAHRSAGVVVATSKAHAAELERLRAGRVPIVRIDAAGVPDPDAAQVGATNWAGMREATQHLIDLGHRRIGFIGGPSDVQVAQDRLEGYTAALRRNGIDVDPALIRPGDFMTGSGQEGARALLSLADPPTAIAATSDLEAMGVYHEAQARGLRVPEDLSVVGFDDTVLCDYLSPPLTTVRQPLAEMADQAVRLLGDLADGSHPTHPRLELSTTLVTRGSTAPPRR